MNDNVLNILLNNNKLNSTCLFCFKSCEASASINDTFEIWDEEHTHSISLLSIVKSLFPRFEIILNKCCYDCSACLIKMYKIYQQNQKIQTVIRSANEALALTVNKIDFEQIKVKKIFLDPNKNIISIQGTKKIDPELEDSSCANFKCKNCSMAFDSIKKLQVHSEALHLNKNNANVCDICGKIFKKPSALKSHLISHNEKQCPYCSKLLKNNSYFKVHLDKHKYGLNKNKSKTVYKCHDCAYKSFSKGSLEAHIYKMHLNIKPFKCFECDKSFYKKSNLTEHVNFVHSKSNNVICQYCGGKFSCNKTLELHLKLHTNETPYECEVCNMKFVTSGRRRNHIIRKHMPKTEKCHMCDKKFSLKWSLNSHLKRCHS